MEDRRIQKTKKILAEALKDLIVEKGYEAITIQDIIDRANVGRSTFYTHYENKEQLLLGNINFQRALIDAPADEDHPMGINLAYLFRHTREHLDLARRLRGSTGLTLLRQFFTDVCVGKIMDYHRHAIPRNKKGRQLYTYKAMAAAAGIVAILFQWLEDGATIPEEEMIAYAGTLLGKVVS